MNPAVLVASLLTTIADCEKPDQPVPLGPLYAGLMQFGVNYLQFSHVLVVLEKNGLLRASRETVVLTDLGRQKAIELDRILSSTRN